MKNHLSPERGHSCPLGQHEPFRPSERSQAAHPPSGQECPRPGQDRARQKERGHSCPLPFLVTLALLAVALPARALEYVAFFGPVTVDTRRPDLTVATLDTPLQALAASTQPVAWAILNQGAAPTPGGWVDRVYLATNAAGTNGRLVGEFPASGPLGTNQSLPRFQSIPIPGDLVPDRDYWWVVATDAANAVDESNEINNTRISDQPMWLLRSPAPNLRVASVSASASPMSGQPVTISWAVTNAGNWSTGAGLWQDAVYLSATTNLDGTALPLGRATRPRPLGTNESYASSLTATLQQGLSGTRYFIVQTDADNRVNEGVFENDNTTASAPVAITLTPPPDLQVAAITAPSNALSGTSLAVSWVVTNAGPGLTAESGWTDDVYLSPTATLGTNALLLGSFPHAGALTNGQAYYSSASIPLPASLSGSYYLLVHTDARNQVFEYVFETNNVAVTANPILITLTPPPDLAVSQVTAPATALASHPLTVSYAVTNRGTDTLLAFMWEDRLYLATNATAGARTFLSAQWHFGGLGAGGIYSNTFTVTLPDGLSGPWYAVVETDATGEVFELVKTNNLRASAAPILIESRPSDLVVTSLTAPSSAQAGSSLLVSWTVHNQGPGDTAVTRWTERLVLSADATPGNADDATLLTREHNGLLDDGASYTVSNEVVTVPFSVAPGSYRLFLLTDSGNAVYEAANEGNNASIPRTVAITRTTADLSVTSIEVRERTGMSALQALSEDTLLVSWRVENTGPAAPNSTAWSDAIYLSTNSILDTNAVLLGVSQNPVSLAPGAFYTNTLAVTLPAEIQGNFFVHVLADAATEVIEDNRANNTLAATNTLTVTLRPVPDLSVLSVTSPADGFSGQPMDLSWTVTNRGPATAEGTWYDSVYLSLDPQFEPDLDIYIGYAERPTTLTNGQSYTQTARLEIPAEVSGLVYVFVRCDSTDRLNERGATNNNVGRAATPVSIWLRPPSDLVVGTITIPTNTVAGYEMALTYVLRNQGTNAAFGPWVDALYFSADDQWDIGDTLFTRVSQTGFLAAGGSRTNTVSAPAPGVLPGNYHVIIRTDIVNQVPETNEFNNITATLNQTAAEVQELALGVTATNQLATRQARYYRVHVTAGQWLVLELNCASATAATELFVRYAAIPTRSEFDFTHSNPLQPNHRIVVPDTREGDYYILAYGDFIPTPGTAAFTLSARLSQFLVFDTSFGQGGNAGNLTIPINGVDLDRTCTARLTNGSAGIPAGVNRPAVAHFYESSTRFYATLDLRGLAPGLYTVAVQNGDGSPVTIPNSVEVVSAAGLPSVIPVVSAPNAMRRNLAYAFTVQWGNAGLNDASAPLLTVGNTVPFGLAPGDYSLGTRYTFLGLNTHSGPPGILRPGQTEMMTFHAFSGTEAGEYTAFADRVGKNTSDPMDWSRVLANLPSDDLTRTNFTVLWNQFTNQIGGTWGDYLSMVSRNASLLPPGMGNNRSTGDLERLEWQKALTARTLSISGRVTSASALLDVGNVQVVANPTNGQQSRVVWSLTDGSFLMPDLSPDLYSLAVSGAQGWLPSPVVADTRSGQSVTNITLHLRTGAGLDLQITEAGGRVVPNAWVTIGPATNPVAVAVTDVHGMASLRGLPDGVQSVFVEAESLAPLLASVALAEGTTISRWLSLGKGAEVRGVVHLSSGQPAANALIALDNQQEQVSLSRTTQSAADGSFLASGLAEGNYEVTIVAPTSGAYTNFVQLTGAAPLDLGVVTLPSMPAPVHSPKDGNCVDYTGGNLGFQKELEKIENRVRSRLEAVRAGRGSEYRSVVLQYLDNCYPNMPRREFRDGSATVESGIIGSKLLGESGETVGAGFRQHPQVMSILNGALPVIVPHTFRLSSIKLSSTALCNGGEQTFNLSEILTGEHLGYREGKGGYPTAAIPEPISNYWLFNNTLAGGMGAYGMPHWEANPVFPDTRLITGEIVARLDGPGRARLTLRNVEFRITDAFDFIPGNLGGSFLQKFITRDLALLEFYNYAYDVELYIHWKYGSEEFPMGFIQQADLECCELGGCDPCKQPTAGGPGSGGRSAKDGSPTGGGGSTRPDVCRITPRPVSVDPNDIVGPGGFGPEYWISPDQTFHYTVRFENDPKKAEVPAQVVRITQLLSTNLDLRTFRLGVMGFGTNLVDVPADRVFYQTQVNVTNELGVVVDIVAGLDLAKGEITWEFTSIDPAIGDLPWDPYIGFLPPNTNGIIGQGFVSYTIKPKASIASGDIINAEARIYFDYNEPMDTPRIFNTVDGNLPTSTVLPLPLFTNRNIFPVRWAGADGYGGAGISSYTLYVSDNSGLWQVWLANTPQMESLFVGQCGHTYQFYSVARDHVGNVEAATAVAQAAILLLPNQAPVLEPITNRLMAVGQTLTLTNRAADADVGQQLTFSLAPGAPAGMAVNPTNGVLTWTPACVQGGSSNVITVLATDDGCGSLSSAQSFAVFVTECLQTGLGNTVGAAGSGGCVPVSLESSFGLTNFIFTVSVPPGRFTNFTVNALAPEVGSAMLVSLGTTQAVVTLVPQPGQLLRGPKQFAEVCFSLLPNQTSAFVRMEVKDILGLRENGTPIGNTAGQPGRTVVVSEHPLLECVHGAGGRPDLLLYARPGWTCAIEERASVQPGVPWQEITRGAVTNLVTLLPLTGTNSEGYYRAVRLVSP